MKIIQYASKPSSLGSMRPKPEIWQIVTWGEDDPSDLDPAFRVRIQPGLSGDDLAIALSAAADKHEGIDVPAKVLSWRGAKGDMLVRCDLNDGTFGVMRCTRKA